MFALLALAIYAGFILDSIVALHVLGTTAADVRTARLTWGIAVGFPLILLGSWLATASPPRGVSPLAAEPASA